MYNRKGRGKPGRVAGAADEKEARGVIRAAARAVAEALEGRVCLAATLPAGFTESLVATGIASPTSMEFAPDGRAFVTEQGGSLRVIQNGQLLAAPFVTLPADPVGERGLLGVVADPNFAANKYLYVYYTTTAGTGESHNRVSRFTATGNTAALSSETVLIDLPPIGGGAWHMGGAMRFGIDGKLYVAVGDYEFPAYAQQLTTPAGKLLRFNPDGTIPTDNPFYAQTTGVNKAIWALGLRNPFTIAVQAGTGRMYINDVGQSAYEEIDEAARGANYGWPGSEGPTTVAGHTAPVYAYDRTQGISIIGGAFYPAAGGPFPAQYAGQYFFGDFGGGWIRTMDPATKQVSAFASRMSFITGVNAAADGSIWYLSRGAPSGTGLPNTGSVYRIAYDAFQPPKVNAQPADLLVSAGDPAKFQVSASGSGTVTYQWSRNGTPIAGATTNAYALATTTTADGGARFACTVTNAYGSVTTRQATLTVTTNKRPTATIMTPGVNATFAGGQTITYSAIATDAEDGPLPGSAFTWQINYYTGTVDRPFLLPTTGSASGSFVAPNESPYTEANVFFRISLTVTDSAGLSYTTSTDVKPRTAALTLTTNVPGAVVEIDGQPKPAPYVTVGVEGLKRTVGAPAVQVVNGETWQFDRWSDGGTATHPIAFPGTATTLTAYYRKRQVVYASDLPFVGTPANRWGPVERDQSNGEDALGDGRPLTMNGVVYPKGFGVHADSEIVLDLGGKYEAFLADVGLDDEVDTAGSVVFQVWADGAKLYDSGLMIGENPGRAVNVDVRGKQQLRLVAWTGGDDATFDHADWGAARLIVVEAPPPPADPATPVFVSDLPFVGTPTNGWGPLERDKSNGGNAAGDGTVLTLNGTTYAKGLGAHANSEVVFSLGGAYDRFRSDVGIDDEEGFNGSVVFQAWADGTKVFDSGTMTGSTDTKAVDVSVAGAQQLKLVVTDAGDNNYNDHADWAGAVLVPSVGTPPPPPPPDPTPVFVSDLPFVGTPTNGWGPMERDKSNGGSAAGDGATLTLNGTTYAKGLGTHANSEVVLRLNGAYDRFRSDVGIDDEEGFNGSVAFQVWADGAKVFDSGTMYGSTATKAVDVSVAGVQQLRLVTTDAGDNNYNDHADWAGAVLVPSGGTPPTQPTASVANVRLAEGGGSLVFTVVRSSAAVASTVAYATADGTATLADGDYTAAAGTLAFAVGESSKTVVVPIFGDAKIEADETFTLTLSNPNAVALAAVAGAVGTIVNDDFAGVSIAHANVAEGNAGTTDLAFVVTRTDGTLPSALAWATASGTAIAGVDFAAASGTVSFAAGETSRTVVVKVNGDADVEPDETLLVTLAQPTNATIVRGQAVGTIVNDDSAGSVSVADATVAEGNAGTTDLSFVVTRTSGAAAASVAWATGGGTATAGVDYAAASGTLAFAAGETSKTIVVKVTGDAEVEPVETLVVNLSGAAGATIARGQATGTIVNDDLPTLSVADVSAVEGTGGSKAFTFAVTRSSGVGTATVQWQTGDGTATVGDGDYLAASGAISFAAGETSKAVGVTVNGDARAEATEAFAVTLFNPVGATIARAAAVGTITNDDATTISIADASVTEGASGQRSITFTVARSLGVGTAAVNWATAGGTATTGDGDYVGASGTVGFAAGETTKTVSVTVNGDAKVEANETFYVNLTSPAGAVVARAQAVGTIVNDDISPIVLQAESSAVLKNTTFSKSGNGYTGTGYVQFRLGGAAGDAITWSPTVSLGGARTLQVRYATAYGSTNLKLVVNGVTVVPTVSFPSTGGSNRWAVATLNVTLLAGANTVALASNGGLFAVNIDSLTVS